MSLLINQAPAEQDETECETCQGEGEIDLSLGGEWNSGVVKCFDCKGLGTRRLKRKGVNGGAPHD